MRIVYSGLLAAALLGGTAPKASACALPEASLTVPPSKLLHQLKTAPAPLLAAADKFSVAMEACYDSPLGPLQLAPMVKQADGVAANMAALRALAEEGVRANELDFETLLSSELWGDIESLRVAGAYGAAWGRLAAAVRHISADEKRKAMRQALASMRGLTFEFKHPVLVQRAMYGLATAQIEAGDVETAKQTLERLRQSLQHSLRAGGAADFKTAIDAFYARISAADYRPPVALFAEAPTKKKPRLSKGAGDEALGLARQALTEARPASEIVALLEPLFDGSADVDALQAALRLVASDALLVEAMDYEPGRSLRIMRRAFPTGQYGQLVAAWGGVKAFHPHMPPPMKRQVDYHMGVARLNLGSHKQAITHLWAARQGLEDGAIAKRIDKLIALAQLSIDEPPTPARLQLAAAFKDMPPPPPQGNATPSLDDLLALRARVVLARAAAEQKQWPEADKILTGIGPAMPGYQLFLGMRVRLLAEAVKARLAKGEARAEVQKTGRGAVSLYKLWLAADCPPGCLTGARLPVHRAAMQIVMTADLASEDFGTAYGRFVEEGGDRRLVLTRALGYLVAAQDAPRLMALLEPDQEAEAALVLGFWKRYLAKLPDADGLAGHYDWLASALADLQGRPRAVLLERLIEHDLAGAKPVAALRHAEKLAAGFPRRPSAWFMRAAALQANQRNMEAARALSALARRTPADDPVGMGARLGLAALFIELQQGEKACAMRIKIFARPTANDNWAAAAQTFPILKDWHKRTQALCS